MAAPPKQPLDEQSLRADAFTTHLQESRLLLKDGGLLLQQIVQQSRDIGRRPVGHAPMADHSPGSCSWMATTSALNCEAFPPSKTTLKVRR